MRFNWNILFFALLFFLVIGYFFVSPKNLEDESGIQMSDGKNYLHGNNYAQLYFYDNVTNCPLSGNITFNGLNLGKSRAGMFNFTNQDYQLSSNRPLEISLVGDTDGCFQKNKNLPFQEIWKISDLDYYFQNGEEMKFEANLNSRWPKYMNERQRFVRPEEVKEIFEKDVKRYLKNKTEEDLDRIATYGMNYRSDDLLFHEAEYWQTPLETLKLGHGDCEDWAVTVLSMMLAYDSSLKCYNTLWETHVGVFCYADDSYLIYDQDKVKSKIKINDKTDSLSIQENKASLRRMLNNYFDSYGISPEERRLHALFNDKESIEFSDNEEFINWMIGLKSF